MPVARVLIGALPRQDVRGNAVEEHTVVAGHHSATREAQQRLLQAGQRFHVQVVGGLVEKQQVAALLERQRQVQAVALAAGKHARRLLLVGALEAEAGHVRTAGHLGFADHHVVQAAGDDFPHVLVTVDARTALVDVGNLHRLAELQAAGGGLLDAHDHLEQGGLAHAVGADHADDAVARQLEGQVVHEHAVAELLVQVLDLEDLGAQARTGRDLDLGEVELLGLRGLGGHLVVTLQTGAALRLTRLRRAADPLELACQAFLQLLIALLLARHTRGLGLQVRGVIALVGVQAAAVDLADPLGHVVQEVAIVRDGQHGAGVLVQELLQPQHGLGVQVVGRLVEKQQVGGLEQQTAQGHATTLAAGEHVHRHVGVGALQRVHGLGQLAVQVPAVGRVDGVLQLAHLLHERVEVGVGLAHERADLVEAGYVGLHVGERHLDVLQDGLVLVQRRLLLQDAHRVAGGQARVAVADLLDAGHDLEQRGLAHAVRAHNADLRAGIERQGDIVEDDLVAVRLARLVHLVDELCHDAPLCLTRRHCPPKKPFL